MLSENNEQKIRHKKANTAKQRHPENIATVAISEHIGQFWPLRIIIHRHMASLGKQCFHGITGNGHKASPANSLLKCLAVNVCCVCMLSSFFLFDGNSSGYIGSVFRPCHSVLNTFNRIFHLRQPNLAFLTAADLFSITDNDSLCLFRAVFFSVFL